MTTKTIRPKINEEMLKKLKIAYPEETVMLTNTQTLEWAINKLLEIREINKKNL